jgi:autotransporter-associated beta strand protein
MQFLQKSCWCLIAALMASAIGTHAQSRPPLPDVSVPPGVRGEAAITALGGNLAGVAAHYGKTADELASLFRHDGSLRLDGSGHLYYTCEGLVAVTNAAAPAGGTPVVEAIAPLSQTFLLHSKPGASKIIYLDFDGHTISGTQWNTDYNGGADIVAPPWDTDGDPNSFGTAEQTAIQQVWYRVAEDYAPFDVDVTTEYPGEAALTRQNTPDQNYGMRALISPISSYIGQYGGIAWLDSFNDTGDRYKPALIFPENLANSEKYIGEAVAHEVGHTLGLSHDGVTGGDAYYSGQGNWAPIMGVGYYKPISQWSKGEYANANNTENDLATINGYLSYRANDFGTNLAGAKVLTGHDISTNGIINRTGQSDYTKFTVEAGTIQATAVPWERGSDLHMAITLYNNAGTVLTNVESVDDSGGTHAVSLQAAVPAGTYHLAVAGKGSGDPLTTGYSSYASLGQYTLNLTLPGPPAWRPTVAGNYSWTNATNWLSGSAPNAVDLAVKITNNIAGNQVVTLDSAPVVGQLWLGCTNAAGGFLLRNGSGGPLKFDVSTGSALLLKNGAGNDEIAAAILPLDPLVVSNGPAGSFKISGPVSGTNNFIKAGPGTLTLAGTNTFTGSVTVSNGVLVLDTNGALAGSFIELKNGTLLDVSRKPAFVLAANQTLGGSGAVVGTITASGTLAPGSSIGTLNVTGAVNLAAGGTLVCELAGTNASPGVDNDVLTATAALSVSSSSETPFIIRPVAPALAGWDNQRNYSWTIATAAGGISGFATNKFAVDAGAFTNNLGGGGFAVSVSGNSLQLDFVANIVPVLFTSAGLAGNGTFQLAATGVPGNPYSLWGATNLAPPAWTFVAATNADGNGAIIFAGLPTTNSPQQFFRLSSP